MSIMYNLEREKGVEEKGGPRGRGSIFQVIKHCGVIVVTFNYLYFIERILFKLHFDNDRNNGNSNSYNFYGNWKNYTAKYLCLKIKSIHNIDDV